MRLLISEAVRQARSKGGRATAALPPERLSAIRRKAAATRAANRAASTDAQAVAVIACPHCTSAPGWEVRTCCACQGQRRVSLADAQHRSVWAVPGCAC